ncbi:MAG: hypothetical protein R2758_15110 [Bacteroidales bacterium]
MELPSDTSIPLKGAECVVVGRSNIVGRPVTSFFHRRELMQP